jgi:L-alanine-DL-glutamate epimerase-like enolase superfamily enzyme
VKITSVQTYKFSVPLGQETRDPATGERLSSTAKPWLLLAIDTDTGITGWGEGTGEWLTEPVEAMLLSWRELLIGRDPLPVVAICDDIQDRLPWKGNPLETRTSPMDAAAVDHTTRCVRSMREAVGEAFDLLLDAHGSPTPELSLACAAGIAPYRPLFLEEPVKVGSLAALLEVSRKSDVPIATGEKLFHLRDFLPLIEARACAYLQPDVCHCFGITGLVEIGRAAREAQMLMAPHNAGGPLALAASLSADAVMPNFLIQEMGDEWFQRFSEYVEHDWSIADGYISLSDAPGLGLSVKVQDIVNLPYEPLPYRQYRHADGSWKGW